MENKRNIILLNWYSEEEAGTSFRRNFIHLVHIIGFQLIYNVHYFTNNNPHTELAMHNAYTGIYTEVEERIDWHTVGCCKIMLCQSVPTMAQLCQQ